MKRRGLLKDAGPTQQKQPPGGRNRHSINLVDLAKPAKESLKQLKTKNTDLDDDANTRDSGAAAIEFNA